MLHITNGDSAVRVMREAGIAGEFLPWRDVLHEGPAPAGLTLGEMSKVRAAFIAACGWSEEKQAREGFQERDARLATFRDHEEVILWFEHDLYDQLQLLQLLDWFSARGPGDTRLSIICVDDYLGAMAPERMGELYGTQSRVSSAQLTLGKDAWAAFCSADPMGWEALTGKDTAVLPFLAGSVIRHLEQYPSLQNGTNRTETQILKAVNAGLSRPGQIFEASQNDEDARFMGDSTFWIYLNNMLESDPPLLRMVNADSFAFPTAYPYPEEFRNQHSAITEAGIEVLNNKRDWIEINGIDKWLGGVHLHSANIWRWDAAGGRLLKADA